MGRPLRDTAPGKVHLITTRTARAELLLVPDPKLNGIVGGVIARYVEMFGIELFAYCILSNHYHLLIRAPEGLLPRFVENVNREISHRVNRLLRRKGYVWGRRYDDQVTIEPYDALEGMLYIVTNPVNHGLVANPRHWPGLTCYQQLLTEKPRDFYFVHYTEYRRAKRRALFTGDQVHPSDYQSKHTLKLSPLPIYESLSTDERLKTIKKLIEKRTLRLYRERQAEGKSFLGRKAVLKQPRQGRIPERPSQSPRPRCYTRNPQAGLAFRQEEKLKRAAYDVASYKYRAGNLSTEFPPHCFKPPTHHLPKRFLLRPSPT